MCYRHPLLRVSAREFPDPNVLRNMLMIKAVCDGRGNEIVGLAKTNLVR
jgi:hypothetical protein